MKKVISFVVMMVVLLSLCVTAMAATTDFVPSIDEKPAPTIESITITTKDGEWTCTEHAHEVCILVTPVSEISEEDRLSDAIKQAIVDVYNKIKSAVNLTDIFKGFPEVDGMVVRDLFDVSSDCIDLDEVFPLDGTKIKITFDLGVSASEKILTFAMRDGKWDKIETVNNGDGTVSADFDHFCPVAFLTSESKVGISPDTGDASSLGLWITLLVVSVVMIAAIAFIALRKKSTNK